MIKQRRYLAILLLALNFIQRGNTCNASSKTDDSHTLKKSTKCNSAKWPKITQKYKNSVVQIYAYVNMFNFSDPSKTGSEQYLKMGSGFFISDDGYLLTNFHVSSNAPIIEIRMPVLGDRGIEAEFIGCFPQRDFTLLKVKDTHLEDIKNAIGPDKITAFEFGNSDNIVESQEVMCLGYPLGQKNLKVSIGNIAGRESIDEIGECIQTTTPINQGNSGGPFLDEEGNLIGIATLRVSDTDGIGYFIPIKTISAALESVRTKKIVKNINLGITIQSTTTETLVFLGNPTDGGIYVSKVEDESLARKNGIMSGDVIYAIDGFKIDRYGYFRPSWRDAKISFSDYISQTEAKGIVQLTIYRNGKKLESKINLENEDNFSIDFFYPWLQDAPDYERIGGLVVSQLTLNHVAENCSVKHTLKYLKNRNKLNPRVLISHIYPGSIALSCHFPSDDVIIKKVNEVEIKTVQDFRNAVLVGNNKNPSYLTIETEGGFFTALPIKKLIEEESLVTSINYLDRSDLVEKLMKEINSF